MSFCFTVELNSETLYVFKILSNCERVVFLDMNQFQILKRRKTKTNKKNTQIIKAFKKPFHDTQNQLLIFSLVLYAVSLLPIACSPRLPLSSESQWNIPTEQEMKSVSGQKKEIGFCTILSYIRAVLSLITRSRLGKGANN